MKVLIILASYNGEKYIKEQLDSILSQQGIEIYITIFDDVSKDDTAAIVNSFRDDDRIQLVKNNFPTGSAASNFFGAIKYLSEDFIKQYDFVSLADQDDIWLPKKMISAVEMLNSKKSSLYLSNLILWNEKTNKKSFIKKCFPQKKYDFLFEGGSAGCTYVFTSKFALDLKFYLNKIDYSNWKFFSHDWFIYFFARINNYKISIDSNAYILYRIHEQNVHGQLNTISIYAIKERLKLIKAGWYFQQIKEFSKLVPQNSEYRNIYNLYSKNYFTRFYVIFRYNFKLIRSRSKMIQFAILSLLPIKIKKSNV
ncbi:UDP-Glc:alpha-D-GlcNAc-diphosphoundecaprenol beta-1,3-glucosyltransferase WfgD [compost metagenome]